MSTYYTQCILLGYLITAPIPNFATPQSNGHSRLIRYCHMLMLPSLLLAPSAITEHVARSLYIPISCLHLVRLRCCHMLVLPSLWTVKCLYFPLSCLHLARACWLVLPSLLLAYRSGPHAYGTVVSSIGHFCRRVNCFVIHSTSQCTTQKHIGAADMHTF